MTGEKGERMVELYVRVSDPLGMLHDYDQATADQVEQAGYIPASRLEAALHAKEAELGEAYKALAEAKDEAESALAHRNQLQADIEAEQAGRLELRRRFGARDDETMGAFIARLAAQVATITAQLQAVTAERDNLSAQLAEEGTRRTWMTDQLHAKEAELVHLVSSALDVLSFHIDARPGGKLFGALRALGDALAPHCKRQPPPSPQVAQASESCGHLWQSDGVATVCARCGTSCAPTEQASGEPIIRPASAYYDTTPHTDEPEPVRFGDKPAPGVSKEYDVGYCTGYLDGATDAPGKPAPGGVDLLTLAVIADGKGDTAEALSKVISHLQFAPDYVAREELVSVLAEAGAGAESVEDVLSTARTLLRTRRHARKGGKANG